MAQEVGFDACGLARAEALSENDFPLRRWLSRGWHAGLGYMERNVEKREDPRLLVPGAKTVICLLRGYNPLHEPTQPRAGRIARYACGEDYHEQLRPMLYRLRSMLGIEAKICCDTVPISDKRWAQRAGLGWTGRHTLLISKEWGTWVNLAELVTTEEADEYDSPAEGQCGGCRRCIDACPNGALSDGELPMIDLRRCTAYHTIENRAEALPPDLRTGGYIFGCDVCQRACPYNSAPTLCRRERQGSDYTAALDSLPEGDEAGEVFSTLTRHSPMSRISYRQYVRNCMHSAAQRADAAQGGRSMLAGEEV